MSPLRVMRRHVLTKKSKCIFFKSIFFQSVKLCIVSCQVFEVNLRTSLRRLKSRAMSTSNGLLFAFGSAHWIGKSQMTEKSVKLAPSVCTFKQERKVGAPLCRQIVLRPAEFLSVSRSAEAGSLRGFPCRGLANLAAGLA